MISRVRFQDYKVLRAVEIELGRLNVLVGRNGVGKSTILDGLSIFLGLSQGQPGEDQWKRGRPGLVYAGSHAVERLVARPTSSAFEVEVCAADGHQFGLRAQLPKDAHSLAQFDLWLGQPGSEDRQSFSDEERGNPRDFFRKVAESGLGAVAYFRLDPKVLATPHYSDTEVPQIAFDGSGLASVLSYLQGLRDGVLDLIEKDVSAVLPLARRIRTLPARFEQKERLRIVVNGQESWVDQTRELTGTRLEVEWGDSGWIPAEHLSEGTLLMIGLVTILRFRPPQLLLLDDIDKALHPVAQGDLVRTLKRLVDNVDHMQILATAHSPFILDALDPNEVLVVGADAAGGAKVCRLDHHPAWAKKGRYLASGEFWSAIGEGWVAENVR